MRFLTTTQAAQAAAASSTPVLLVTLAHRAPGISRNLYYAAQNVGNVNHGYSLGGVSYMHYIAAGGSPVLSWSVPFIGGLSSLLAGSLSIAGANAANTLWLDYLDEGSLVGAEATFELVFRTGSETAADKVSLGSGIFQRMTRAGVQSVPMQFAGRLVRPTMQFPRWTIDAADWTFADLGMFGQAKPVVFGDCTGSRFDVVSTPTDEVWPHLPLPLVNGMDQEYLAFDDSDGAGSELLVLIAGVPCTVAAGSQSIGSGVAKITDTDFVAWVRPHRVNANTDAGVTNPEYARSGDLDEYATLTSAAGADLLQIDFPQVPSALGLFAASDSYAAADVTVYAILSGASSVPTMKTYLGASLIDTQNPSVTGTRTSFTATVGDHLTNGWDDTNGLSVEFNETNGTLYVHRVVVAIKFRSAEALAAWQQQQVYLSELGFTESSSAATDDYADEGYVTPPGTSRITTPLSNPADQIEATLRNKTWGAGLLGTAYADTIGTGVNLSGNIGNETSIQLGDADAVKIEAGMLLICDYETMRVTKHPNVLKSNAGFEAGDLTNWAAPGSGYPDDTYEASTAKAYSGTYSYHVINTLSGHGIQRTTSCLDGETYTLSCWVWVVSGAAILAFGGGGGWSNDTATSATTGAWEQLSITLTCDAGTGGYAAGYVILRGVCEAYYDDVTLTRGSTVLAYTPGSTVDVDRGQLGSRVTCHNDAALLYDVSTDGEVDCASFRGARELLRYPTGSNLFTTEQGFEAGSLSDWTEYDPDTKGAIGLLSGGIRREILSCARSATGDTTPAAEYTIAPSNGSWHILSVYTVGAVSVKNSQITLTDGSDTSTWTFTTPHKTTDVDPSPTRIEIVFKAWAASMTVRLHAPTDSTGSLQYDEPDLRLLGDVEWQYQQTDAVPMADFLDEAGKEAALTLFQDGTNRITARVLDLYRDENDLPELTTADILVENGTPQLFITSRPVDEVYTGVAIEYDYDYVLGQYRRRTYVTSSLAYTQQRVSSFSDPDLTVSDGAGLSRIFPSGRWTSGNASTTTSGTNNKVVTVTGATFQTDGTAAGDWFYFTYVAGSTYMLGVIASVDSETQITLVDPAMYLSAVTGHYGTFPTLYLSGGSIWLPYVSGGVGAEANPFAIEQNAEAPFGWNVPTAADPVADDRIYKVTTDSDDGTGTRDQHDIVYSAREREAARRIGQLGYENTLRISARRIRDRESAVWLRNRLFDLHHDGYILDVTTPLNRVAIECGDQVLVTHTLVPTGSIRGVVIGQTVDVQAARVQHRILTLPEVR